jgi:signal transduction histidine kinase/DNA-binding response OmpR family regulator
MPTTSPVNILLVDDRAENLLALEAMLEPLGQNLVKAQSGEDALKYLLRQDCAVILLDVQMPGMDGFETAELIRGRDRSKHTPIIFLTAINTSDTHVSRGYRIGAVDFLLKPIEPDILISKVAVFVDLGQKADKIAHQADELEVTIHALEQQIDERVRTEAALRRARDQLEQRVRERTAGLAAANQTLRAEIAERERAERALRFLAQASSLLAESIEYEERLAHVAQLAVPAIADWCLIDVLEEREHLRHAAFAAVDQSKEVLAREHLRRYPFDPGAPHGALQVLRTRRPELCAQVTNELPIGSAQDPQYQELLRSIGLKSFISVPLEARGRVLGVLTIAISESDRRYQPADLALAEDLAHRIAAAIDNAQLYRAAQDSIRMRDVFLSVAAHELRTPLTSLLGYTQLVERRAEHASTISDRDRQALRVVADQATRLSKMVTSLLDISRLQLGQLSIEPMPLDLGALAARLVEQARPLLLQHSIDYIGIGAPALISGDELRLEQALQNLIQNAIKYSPDGGAITVRVASDATRASVVVTDSGIGIPPEALSQLFQRFYRAPNVDPQHISGLGVGLYVVKEIVELHCGTVDVSSKVGVGSTFTISIPLLMQPAGIIRA